MGMSKKKKIAVLASGGLDSDVLIADLSTQGYRVFPIYIQQGLAWESAERYWLQNYLAALSMQTIEPLKILSIPLDDIYQDHWSLKGKNVPGAKTSDEAVYLPGRNLILLSKTAVYCALHQISEIATAPLNHNPFSDATPLFYRSFAKAIRVALDFSITIRTPYRCLQKIQVIRRGSSWPLHLSFSCLAPIGRNHCGRCNKCAERKRAFKNAQIKDQTHYG